MDKTLSFVMSELDKLLIVDAFKIKGEENNESVILVATDAYSMSIDNPDIRLIIQQDLSIRFDAMIQCMGRAEKKSQQSTFLSLTPKQTQVKSPEKIEKIQVKQATPATGNPQPSALLSRASFSPLAQEVNLNASDNESIQSPKNEQKMLNKLSNPTTEQLFELLSTNTKITSQSKQSKKQASKSDIQKCAAFLYEIFNFIHIAKYCQLFLLAWYDDQTYAPANNTASTTPSLPAFCCNGPGCQSKDPEFLKKISFIKTETIKYTETQRGWLI